MTVNEQIKARRKWLGISQAELAKRMGTWPNNISRLENNDYKPSLRSLERVAEALGTTVKITLEITND